MDNFQIETAQNISISQNIASVLDRIFAFLIDLMVLVFYILVVNFTVAGLELPGIDRWIYLLIMGLPIFLYFLLWETFWNGRTPGKAALEIRVVKLDGSEPRFSNYALRWLLRIVDITLSSGSVAVVVILLNGKGQRLGDMAAGTTVISEKKKIGLQNTLLMEIPEDYQPTYPQVSVLSDTDIQEIKGLYYNALKNHDHKIIRSLAEKVSELLEVKPAQLPTEFIKTVITDYNYFTQK
ncbi:MAG TPA: RDD family protein [Salinimicrobium sp.]|nr:RDD family protein [Salinimicrobium sp.]